MSYIIPKNDSASNRLSQLLGSYHKKFTCDKTPYLERVAKTYNLSESSFDSYCGQYVETGLENVASPSTESVIL